MITSTLETDHPHGDTHQTHGDFPSALQTAYRRFQDEATPSTSEMLLHEAGLGFLGARCDLQRDFDHHRFRRSLAHMLDIDSFNLLQVVGDSGSAFSTAGREVAIRVLADSIGTETVIEYGYTASLHDTNWIVNEILERCEGCAARAVGSLVAESGTAVERWSCEASGRVKNFVLAYNGRDDEGGTKFGDDMWLSDLVMVADEGDLMVCLEGGVQSFEQLVNVLGNGIRVIAITGPGMRAEGPRRFSAAEMVRKLVDCCQHDTSYEAVRKAGTEYLEQWEELKHKPTQYTRVENALNRLLTKAFDPGLVSVMVVS